MTTTAPRRQPARLRLLSDPYVAVAGGLAAAAGLAAAVAFGTSTALGDGPPTLEREVPALTVSTGEYDQMQDYVDTLIYWHHNPDWTPARADRGYPPRGAETCRRVGLVHSTPSQVRCSFPPSC